MRRFVFSALAASLVVATADAGLAALGSRAAVGFLDVVRLCFALSMLALVPALFIGCAETLLLGERIVIHPKVDFPSSLNVLAAIHCAVDRCCCEALFQLHFVGLLELSLAQFDRAWGSIPQTAC